MNNEIYLKGRNGYDVYVNKMYRSTLLCEKYFRQIRL